MDVEEQQVEEEGETLTPFWIQQTTTATTTTTATRRRRNLTSGVALFILFITSFIILSFLLLPQLSKPNSFKRSWDSINITLVLLALLFGFLSRNNNHNLEFNSTIESDSRVDSKIGNERVNKSVDTGWYKYSDHTNNGIGLSSNRNHDPANVSLSRNRYHDPTIGFDRIDGEIGDKSNESVNSGWYKYSDKSSDRIHNPIVGDDDIGNQYHDPTVGFDRAHRGDNHKVEKLNETVNGGWYEYSDPTVVIGLRRSHNSYPDLREVGEVEDSGDKMQFHEDSSSDASPMSQKSSPDRRLEDSVYEDGTIEREVKSGNNGIVLGISDGIARVSGLDGVAAGEIVEFDEGTIGVVMNTDSTDNVGVVLMGEGLLIREGSYVKATGKIAQEPGNVSEAGLGPVVDASDKYGISDPENKEVRRGVRRRTRRTAGNKGKLSDEVSGLEPPGRKISHRRSKSSGLELPNERLSHRKTKSSGSERFGTVLLVGKGVARIYGLGEVTEGEIVEFEEGTIGIVSNSESANNVGVVLMGDGLLIREGSLVKATGKIAQIPVTEARLGSVINDLAKPIDSKGETKVSEEMEIKRMSTVGRRRTRRTTGSIEDKENFMEEVSGFEYQDRSSNRSTKRTYVESKTPKVDDVNDQSEVNEYESSPEMLVQDTQSSPPAQNNQNERKKGGANATMDFLSSLTKRKKKQRQKSVENFDTFLESPPSSPRPSSKSFFSSMKGKNKQVITDPPPPPPLPLYTASREQKSAPTTAPAATRRPPLPVNVQKFEEVESQKRESSFSGAESPLHPIPSPPPPPPFQMSGWKFVMRGDYVNIGSVNSSRSVSPEREEVVDSPMGSELGGNDVAMGSMFCPSPDVNSKADMFIAKFRAGLKLQKMNSMKMKQGVGLSNLGSVSTLDQAQA